MRTILFAALAAAVFFATPAEARDVRVPVPAEVSQSDQAAQTLYAQLRQAATRACRDSGVYGYRKPAARRACIAATLETAVAQANLPLLTAQHRGKPTQPVLAAR